MTSVVSVVIGAVFLAAVQAQAPGKYYSGSGSAADGTCPMTSCPMDCQPWQWRKGCTFNSSGYCTDCTGLGTDKYFVATGGLTDSCTQTSQRTCSAGFVNLNKNSTFEGSCTPCTSISAGYYFTTPASPRSTCADQTAPRNPCAVGYKDDNYNNQYLAPSCTLCTGISAGYYWVSRTPGQCTSDPKPTCSTGFALTSYTDPFVNGTCVACTAVQNQYFVPNPVASATCSMQACTDSGCQIGEYRASCGGSFAGVCTKCTNGNASQIYTSTGGLNNICLVDGCQKTCDKGQFIAGCGVPGNRLTDLTCQNCNNSRTNYTYYTGMGGYLIDSCPTTPCPTCPWGFYTLGCGDLSAGVCSRCTNTV